MDPDSISHKTQFTAHSVCPFSDVVLLFWKTNKKTVTQKKCSDQEPSVHSTELLRIGGGW